ncbi:YgjV family protein [Vibrio sp. TH_r3]|uniref:YgjV family protein n=1 Tax=Vibrio sp. TH_r3 TaxID=3082084 RepID=UPI002954FE2A|nr:YgjV family protein [Vibrio sp. TH_r3]MDV7103715.1 YgjV family protein [Vibrio sp. TH_r3]
MNNQEIIAQLFGLVSLLLGISVFYQKDDRKLKIVMLIFNVNHLIHFLILGSVVSALGAMLSTIRTGLAIRFSSMWIAAPFIAISIISGVMLADTLWQLWAIAGTVFGTYSVFLLSGIKMRCGFLLGSTCWLINNISVGSIGGTMLEFTVIVMNLITIKRLYFDSKLPVTTDRI